MYRCVQFRTVSMEQIIEDTYGANVEEEIALIRYLEAFDCKFFGLHNSNAIPVVGNLLTKKEWMEEYVEKRYNDMPERVRTMRPNQAQKGVPIMLQGRNSEEGINLSI